jgi:hypothetical protein
LRRALSVKDVDVEELMDEESDYYRNRQLSHGSTAHHEAHKGTKTQRE